MIHVLGAIIGLLLVSGSASPPTGHVPGSRADARNEGEMVQHAVLIRSGADIDPNTLLQEYVDQVNSLLEAYQNGLRLISAAVSAGKLTPEEAEALKLEGARVVVSRFETLKELYDSLLPDNGEEDANPAESDEESSGDGLIRIADHAGRIPCPGIFHNRVHEEIPSRLHTAWMD